MRNTHLSVCFCRWIEIGDFGATKKQTLIFYLYVIESLFLLDSNYCGFYTYELSNTLFLYARPTDSRGEGKDVQSFAILGFDNCYIITNC